MTTGMTVQDKLRAAVPEGAREAWYRFVAGATAFLLAFGVLDNQEAALWTQLGLTAVTSLFAMLYSTQAWRTALYALVGPVGSVLMAYGLVADERWALITAAVGQLFGIATMAAKTVQVPTAPGSSTPPLAA
ncbi:membrane protein [Gordonia phage BiggityBass]|nr:membrane protein [Gordonia phage BiggityBass]